MKEKRQGNYRRVAPFVPTKQEWDELRYWRLRGMSYQALADKYGYSLRGIWMRAKRLEKIYGTLPKIQRHDKRDYAADYKRIKELREAGLPWELIGKALRRGTASVQVYYSQLGSRFVTPM